MRAHVTATALCLFVVVFASGCTSKPPSSSTIRVGGQVFEFNYKQTSELRFRINRSATSPWWYRLKRDFAMNRPKWRIQGSSQETPVRDTLANSRLLDHLLDTLNTLEYLAKAPNGTLESFGLDNPTYSLNWSAGQKKFELLIGDYDSHSTGYFAKASTSKDVILVKGAAIAMLGHLKTPLKVREVRLAAMNRDDVDEIELFQKGKPVLYAQRQGVDWVGRQQKPLVKNVRHFLDQIVHTRLKSIIEEPKKIAQITSLFSPPLFKTVLKDRHGHPTEISLSARNGRLFATHSSRPEAVFELHPTTLRLFRGML